MQFDARAAKLLQPDEHMTIKGSPGLRLVASKTRKTWIYRYKSPTTGLMKQTKIGEWPSMSAAKAIAEWETLREVRDAGGEPGIERRTPTIVSQESGYTVAIVCRDYLVGHVERRRKTKGANEVARMFKTMLGDFGNVQAANVTRKEAFALLESHSDHPVQAGKLRSELGAAWDYALDAGRLPEASPNWWRQIMRGRLQSKGKKIEGENIGRTKRVLSNDETGAVIQWLPNFSRMLEDTLTMYLWTVTRGSEIMSVMGSEIGEENDVLWWTIPKVKTKNARHEEATDLRVPLIGRAESIIKRRMDRYGKGYLFPKVGGHTLQKVISETVHYHQPYSKTKPDQIRARLTVTHWAPHDLRRTSRTILASLGCPSEVAESIMGHMLPGVEGVYNKYKYDKERLEWLTRLSARLEELASSVSSR